MICFIRRSTIDYDIRLRKYVEACIETGTPYYAITWDRQRNCTCVYENEFQYKAFAPYGGGWRNLLMLLGWFFFVYYHLLRNFGKYRVIHACNIEILLMVLPFLLLKKRVFFDIYDSFNTKIEAIVSKWADVLILPHHKRLVQVGVTVDDLKRFFVVENVPRFSSKMEIRKYDLNKCNTHIKLSYVGVFEKEIRGLENLLRLVYEDDRFELQIAGVGANMESMVEEYARKCDRICYHGKVSYETALEIMNNSYFIVALYYQLNPLHRFASPNKFYESLYLGKPIITSLNTLIGDQVIDGNTGYAIGDDYASLKSLFSNFYSEEFATNYKVKSDNCSDLWKSKYSMYFDKVLKNDYINLVNQID